MLRSVRRANSRETSGAHEVGVSAAAAPITIRPSERELLLERDHRVEGRAVFEEAENHDAPAGSSGEPGVDQRLAGSADGLDHDVEARIEAFLGESSLGCGERRDSERLGDASLVLVACARHDFPRSRKTGGEGAEQADRPASEHEHPLASDALRAIDGVERHGERLDQGRDGRREARVDGVQPFRCGADELGEAPGPVDAGDLERGADRVPALVAGLAFAAGREGLDDHSRAE